MTTVEGRALNQYPVVSVLMPIRNEARYIERSLGAVLAQDYPQGRLEVLVLDGMSTDGTREIVGRVASGVTNVRLVDNPLGIVSTALNCGLRESRGEIVLLVGGHCEIARDYVRQCVSCLAETQSACVGGPIQTIGESHAASTIALAVSSPFGVGNAHFRTSTFEGYVDTVAFGAYRREVFEQIGLFDEELVRNQDDEFNFRLSQSGGRIFMSPAIKSVYFSRASLRGLWKQYFQYGFWKVRLIQKRGGIPSWRLAVAPCFVLGLILSLLVAAVTQNAWWALVVLGPYLASNVVSSLSIAMRHGWAYLPLLPVAFCTIHLSYGSGFWVGIGRFSFKTHSSASAPSLQNERN